MGESQYRCATSARHTTTAAAPSSGAQNMYWVSGWFNIGDARISSSESALRRNASGFRAPLR